jgi:hypothetical protein
MLEWPNLIVFQNNNFIAKEIHWPMELWNIFYKTIILHWTPLPTEN